MRLSTRLSLCLAAAAALLPSPAHADSLPRCTGAGRDFPLSSRIHGGPRSYAAGGDYGTWYLDLTNTTSRACAGVHPVVVLVDTGRRLRPGQARMDFYDGPHAHPVRFETTDEAELVGAFDDGFPGFTVPARRTLTVRVRLALTADTAADQVTATAAVVQKRGDDGDWIGESNAYRFGIDEEPADPDVDPDHTGAGVLPGTPAPDGTATATAAASASGGGTAAEAGRLPDGAVPPGSRPAVTPSATTGGLLADDELASTGLTTGSVAGAALVLTGAGLLLLRARRRRAATGALPHDPRNG
ncbi:hypothetical protein [Streptomyces mangrovisoli]